MFDMSGTSLSLIWWGRGTTRGITSPIQTDAVDLCALTTRRYATTLFRTEETVWWDLLIRYFHLPHMTPQTQEKTSFPGWTWLELWFWLAIMLGWSYTSWSVAFPNDDGGVSADKCNALNVLNFSLTKYNDKLLWFLLEKKYRGILCWVLRSCTGSKCGKISFSVLGGVLQMVWGSTNRVGCAIKKCSNMYVFGSTWREATLLVCNYSIK